MIKPLDNFCKYLSGGSKEAETSGIQQDGKHWAQNEPQEISQKHGGRSKQQQNPTTLSLLWRWSNSKTGCPETLWNLHLQRWKTWSVRALDNLLYLTLLWARKSTRWSPEVPSNLNYSMINFPQILLKKNYDIIYKAYLFDRDKSEQGVLPIILIFPVLAKK